MEACEVGRASVVLREGGEVTIGANGGAFGLGEDEVAGDDEAPGDPSNAGIKAAIVASDYGNQVRVDRGCRTVTIAIVWMIWPRASTLSSKKG